MTFFLVDLRHKSRYLKKKNYKLALKLCHTQLSTGLVKKINKKKSYTNVICVTIWNVL